MDAIDLALLAELQRDCSLSLEAISEAVGLSPPGCQRRIKKLEASGHIVARRAILDEGKLGFSVTGIFLVKLDKDTPDIERRMRDVTTVRSEVMHCYLIGGEYDFVIICKFRDAEEYTDYIYNFLEIYEDIPILNYSSDIVVRKIKNSTELPL